MTVLAPLALDGVGTPLVESVASHFLRLTIAHQISPNQLSQVLCNDSQFLRIPGQAPQLRWRALYPAMLCSYSPQTEVLVCRLEKLTGQMNLMRGTLLLLRDNISRNQSGAIAEKRRWCPKCYSSEPLDAPEPLIWQLPLIARCPIHDVFLEDQCRNCAAVQLPWRTGLARRHCHKCELPLIRSGPADEPTRWQRWCQFEMLRILEHSSSPEFSGFCSQAANKFVAALPSASSGSRGRLAQGKVIARFRKAVAKWPPLQPRLKTIFQIAATWGTTPLDILLRPKEAASPTMFEANAILPKTPTKRPFKKQHYEQCEARLRDLTNQPAEEALPPAALICREFKVSIPNFIARRSATWNAYQRERMRRLKLRKETEMSSANAYMDDLTTELRRSGLPLQRRKTIEKLVTDLGVSKNIARAALRISLQRAAIEF